MLELEFEATLDGFQADALLGRSAFEVLHQPRDIRRIRALLIEFGRYVANSDTNRGVIVLDEPALSESRLRDEWHWNEAILRPEIYRRLAMVICRNRLPEAVLGELTDGERDAIPEILNHEHTAPRSSRSVGAFYNILRILINQFLKAAGPMTSLQLGEMAGCTYPTVASALEKLQPWLRRHSDRRVELARFPTEQWKRLVANADEVRQTVNFADHSGQPRSVDSLFTRFCNLTLKDVAIGGAAGAHRICPALDLVGNPRLDLTVHAPSGKPNLDFVRRLDPALNLAQRDEPARLVIHTLSQPKVFFETDTDGILWADPVECLLDLHEMHLEPQAKELVRSLVLESL